MTVYRDKRSPYWQYDFQFQGRRFHGSTGCVTKRDAEKFERDCRTQAATGTTQKPSVDVDTACGVYWADKGQFESAAKTTEFQLANIVRRYGGSKVLHEITDLDVARAVAERRGERSKRHKDQLVSNATVNRETELLKRVINHVKTVYRAPEIEWKRHKLREEQERIRYLSDDEEKALREKSLAADADLSDLIEFAELSGQRKDAVVKLIWSKVDLKRQWAEVRTKGGVWHGFPLSERMVEIIANRPKVGPFVFTYVCRKTRPPMTDKNGRKHPGRVKGQRYPFSAQGWTKRWREILTAAGIEDFRFHDLRHTAGTRIARASNIKVAQKLLGHSRIETTARYAHVEESDIRAALARVEESRNSPGVETANTSQSRRNPRV